VTTVIFPEAGAGIVVVRLVALAVVTGARTPLKSTPSFSLVRSKPEPEIVNASPSLAIPGLKPEIAEGAATVKEPLEVQTRRAQSR
jgi:hypothetical protein